MAKPVYQPKAKRVQLTDDHWKRIAFLWHLGKSEYEIEAEMGKECGVYLVRRARRKLGVKAVPVRGLPAAPKKPGKFVTMGDLGRHYLRRVGNELIFRTDDNREEVWVKTDDANGIRFSFRNAKEYLVFKNVMGMTEQRT